MSRMIRPNGLLQKNPMTMAKHKRNFGRTNGGHSDNISSQLSTSIVNLALKHGHFRYFSMKHQYPLSDNPLKTTVNIPPHDAPQSMSSMAHPHLWVATSP